MYSVVPSPAASATKADGQAEAARSARPISAGRSAGRSADSAAVPDPGQRDEAYPAPCRSAGLSPSRGSSGTTSAPSPASAARRDLVICDDNHTSDLVAPQDRGQRVAGQRQRELGPVRPGQLGQPGLGPGEYLNGHQH